MDDPDQTDRPFIPCRIMHLPRERVVEAAENAVRANPMNAPAMHLWSGFSAERDFKKLEIAVLTSKWWPNPGVALTVSFMDNKDPELQQRIAGHMNAWGKYANVEFSLVPSDGNVRISLTGPGYSSFVGTDIYLIPPDQPTMHLQDFSMDTPESEYCRVVRHETGHTLGFPHEHLRREIVDRIDPAKAIAFYAAPPNNWSEDYTRRAVLTPLDMSALIQTNAADEHSIMCYGLPAEILKDGVAVPGGVDIDELDGEFAAKTYPKTLTPTSLFS